MDLNQLEFDLTSSLSGTVSPVVSEAIEELATEGGIEARGAISTRVEVVEFILDLVGYTVERPLHQKHILEPSFGGGDFLIKVVKRLIVAWKNAGAPEPIIDVLGDAIRAVELHRNTFSLTHAAVVNELKQEGISEQSAVTLTDCWLLQGDYLLIPLEEQQFDFVIGNPPYVRQELIPAPLLKEYRCRFRTMYDRADLYIPFIERSLLMLKNRGNLGFICADRWMKNRYGGPLRKFVAENFRLQAYIDMVDTSAFYSDVMAYPAITIICRDKPGSTRIARSPSIDKSTLISLARKFRSKPLEKDDFQVHELANVTVGNQPWLLESSDQMSIIRRLEREFPLLEDTSCKVGIGVATGADEAFIGNYDDLDVEPDRKLPLVTTRDIVGGEVEWTGKGVINPFTDEGGLVDLGEYPRLNRYLESRKELISGRHCAKKNLSVWYRTIDRIWPELVKKPKLLIPDIKGEAHIVFEKGELYPHHNLYFITSEIWDLRALQAVLLSSVTRLFVKIYSTKMRGGYMRFQAQYLRRLRLPYWNDVPDGLKQALIEAAENLDVQACNRAVFRLYKVNSDERSVIDE